MKLILKLSDITEEPVDAIVNAANEELVGGGGVDGAIHRVGGEVIYEECQALRDRLGPIPCPEGHALATSAGNLPARWVIHTVGPVYHGGTRGEAEVLRQAYQSSLRVAEELGAERVSFPCISTGLFRYPMREAARVAIEAVRAFPAQRVQEVLFVVLGMEDFRIYQELLELD